MIVRLPWGLARYVIAVTMAVLLSLVVYLQRTLDAGSDQSLTRIEELSQLPRGEFLKPAMLGYQNLGADILWLRLIQVLGKKRNTADDYEWIYHALDVITTLDPRYAYAYYAGGMALTQLGDRADLSNRLLEKGHQANPNEWNLPFLLGYNYYFMLGDAAAGAEYIGRASRISGGPDFLPGLATRMYAESGNPTVALQFLEALWKQNPDLAIREKLEIRVKEVLIERDLRSLEEAIHRYYQVQQKYPKTLSDLVASGILSQVPEEPLGGTYQLDSDTGQVSSSSRPARLKVFRLDKL